MKQIWLMPFLWLSLALWAGGCSERDVASGPHDAVTLVLKAGKIAGDPRPFRELLDRFERENPGIRVQEETLPASTDEQHQFYVINLEGRSSEFDVFSIDVIWCAEFARAGWVREVSSLLPEKEREDTFPGPLEAVNYQHKIYALPWYIDAGLLYYRRDLLEHYGFQAPQTWPELVRMAQAVLAEKKGLYGFLWQGKQYEGLVCNALEFIRSNGGNLFLEGKVSLDRPRCIQAVRFMRDLIAKYKISPPLVTTATEETTRYIFGNGNALFMRNWPYAWKIFDRAGSGVRSKVGLSPLPFFPGGESAPTLGGWQLALNRYSKHPRQAEKLLKFLTSPDSLKDLALNYGYNPARKSLYSDEKLIREHPILPRLYEVFLKARPRPVTPFYMMISQVLQPEFSAAVSGFKGPEKAMEEAQRQVEHILEMGR
jgi:multiple sugar transport system substrate-binding protein